MRAFSNFNHEWFLKIQPWVLFSNFSHEYQMPHHNFESWSLNPNLFTQTSPFSTTPWQIVNRKLQWMTRDQITNYPCFRRISISLIRRNNWSPKGNMWSAIPVALLFMVVNQNGGSRAAAPKGTKSSRSQGTSIRFFHPSAPQALSALKSALSGLNSALSGKI